ncbi:hypothetical protein ULMS_00060 [Patiriisocius marinistellae]|uniref:Uncharacterized protein n=2 Tax=Patiriisocius marinistellae TaxID=2494560 RepID=A0A5J4FTY7_9FLAO|nr:hypothetical protein ULMS_00060 [Patiriisocius marinistellae]
MGNDQQIESNYISSKTTPIFKGYKDTNGSIYMNEEFQMGSIIMNGKVVANNVALRYNVLDEEIELTKGLNSGITVANVIKKDANIHVSIANETLVFLPSPNKNMRDGYFNVLREGKNISLYKKLSKDYREGKVSVNSIARSVPATFKEQETLYVKIKDGSLMELSNSKSKRKRLFIDKEEAMKNHIDNENLNLRKDDDLISAIDFYNTL